MASKHVYVVLDALMHFQNATDMYVLKPHTTEADMEIITFIVRMLAIHYYACWATEVYHRLIESTCA